MRWFCMILLLGYQLISAGRPANLHILFYKLEAKYCQARHLLNKNRFMKIRDIETCKKLCKYFQCLEDEAFLAFSYCDDDELCKEFENAQEMFTDIAEELILQEEYLKSGGLDENVQNEFEDLSLINEPYELLE